MPFLKGNKVEFKCPVTNQILVDPYNTSCCGYSFEKFLITTIKTEFNPFVDSKKSTNYICPICSKNIDLIIPSTNLKSIISEF